MATFLGIKLNKIAYINFILTELMGKHPHYPQDVSRDYFEKTIGG